MGKAYCKKVRPMVFHKGDLVLRKTLFVPGKDQSKRAPNFEGLYVVKKTFSRRAVLLTRMHEDDLPMNFESLKK